jgi:hypothetical protein
VADDERLGARIVGVVPRLRAAAQAATAVPRAIKAASATTAARADLFLCTKAPPVGRQSAPRLAERDRKVGYVAMSGL